MGGKSKKKDKKLDSEGLKLKGNEAFSKGDSETALKCYTAAIDMDPANAALYSNRAQVYIKQEEFSRAIEDSDMALELNPAFTRAYIRKATALFEMPHIEGSLE